MTQFSRLTKRNLFIALHDALATTLALTLSFYLRFGDITAEHFSILQVILPYFVPFSVVICYASAGGTMARRRRS